MQNGEPHSFSQPGLVLPTQLVQNQIHELAKTLPPPRKQNTACDACRSRKVKCNRIPGQDKVRLRPPSSHLATHPPFISTVSGPSNPLSFLSPLPDSSPSSIVSPKIIPARPSHYLPILFPRSCVPSSHYVQQATSEKKRNAAARRPRGISTSSRLLDVHRLVPSTLNKFRNSHSPTGESAILPWHKSVYGAPWGSKFASYPNTAFHASIPSLLYHLLAPPESGHSDSIFAFSPFKSRSPVYSAWGEMASKLEEEAFRIEFALDLVEVYFQIVHTRIPLLNPIQFRARLNLQATGQRPIISKQEEPLHPALVATVVAWGAKFSEHPLLVADRQRNGGQSLLARTLIDRCREIAEATKVHRIPHKDHVVIALLIETLQCQNPHAENGFHGFWLNCSIRNLLGLQINHKSVMADIKDPETRGTMIFSWWMACLADAYSSLYYRRKPMLDDDDYDIDFYTADPSVQENISPEKPSPREQLEGFYTAAHALARISRQIARLLWRPTTDADGIPVDAAVLYSSELSKWRDAHLAKVGVPPNLAANWDFVSAVSACASDAHYHVIWIALFNAMDDFGVRDDSLSPSGMNQVETVKRKVFDEALNASLRISALAGVLTSNGYLKLDPAVMHVSIIHAGYFLARVGRPEVQNCIEGLEQYSYAYEETKEIAQQIRRDYEQALINGPSLNEMSNTVPRRSASAEATTASSSTNGNGIHQAPHDPMSSDITGLPAVQYLTT
ncbi:hypothetical protein JVU11DRAFT_3568 [Chiua virens]|nr:hypothetical protein JVU11DRAFT_3568 [Chiua virens]